MDMELYKHIVIEYSAEEAERLVAQYGEDWLAKVQEASGRHGPSHLVIACWADANNIGPDEDAWEVGLNLQDAYEGEHESPAAYAQDRIEGAYTIPDFLVGHVDYGSIARSYRYGGGMTFLRIGDSWSVHVFRNC